MGGKGRRLGEGVDLVLDLVLDVVVVLDLVLELVLDLVEGSVPLVLEVLLDDLVEGHDPLVLEVIPDDLVEGPDSLVLLLFAILDDLAVPVVALEALLTPDPLVVSQSSSSEDQSPDHDPLPALPEVPPLDPPPLLPDFPEPEDPEPPLFPDLPLPDDEELLHSLLLEADQYESGEFQWFAAAHNESQLFS